MGIVNEEHKIKPDVEDTEVGKYIKAREFEGDGLVLEVVNFEKVTSENADYGANELDYLYKEGKLGKGETFRYSFRTVSDSPEDSMQRVLESKSAALFIPFADLDPSVGTKVHIKRTGSGRETRYTVKEYVELDF